MSGNFVPTMITRPLPWAASMGSEIRWDPMSSRYAPADYPMIFFDSHQKVGTYLHDVDTAYNRLVDDNRRAGLQPPLTLGIPSFYSQYEVALPVFGLIRSLDYEGITLQRVGVGKSPTELPIIQPNGQDGPALLVGSRYEVCISYDRGEVLPPQYLLGRTHPSGGFVGTTSNSHFRATKQSCRHRAWYLARRQKDPMVKTNQIQGCRHSR